MIIKALELTLTNLSPSM